jgi:hypothetical protein
MCKMYLLILILFPQIKHSSVIKIQSRQIASEVSGSASNSAGHPLEESITARIDNRTSIFSSFAGRVQLMISGLFNTQSYWPRIPILPRVL